MPIRNLDPPPGWTTTTPDFVVTYVELIRTREALRAGRVGESRRGAAVLVAITLQVPPVSKYAPRFVIMMHAASVLGFVRSVQKEHPSVGQEQHAAAHCSYVNATPSAT